MEDYDDEIGVVDSSDESDSEEEDPIMGALASLDLVACASRFGQDLPGLEHIFFSFARRQQPSVAFQRLREANGSVRLECMDQKKSEAAWQESAFKKYSWK